MFNLRFEDYGNPGPFNKQLRCYSAVMMAGKERTDVNKGGKIILPASALDHLTRLHIEYPMLFKLTNRAKNRVTHCGVLEFVAEEGRCYLPYWMMRFLLVGEGDMIQIEYVSLQIARFAKFQPQSVDFLEISNPKAVLENALRNFATLTKGDVISINYNDKDYELCILETRPGNAVSIIECDMDVDFAPPVGYQEPKKEYRSGNKSGETENKHYKVKEKPAQVIEGYRLDGKQSKKTKCTNQEMDTDVVATTSKASGASLSSQKETNLTKGLPFYDYKAGLIRFNRHFPSPKEEEPVLKEEKVQKGGVKLKHI